MNSSYEPTPDLRYEKQTFYTGNGQKIEHLTLMQKWARPMWETRTDQPGGFGAVVTKTWSNTEYEWRAVL